MGRNPEQNQAQREQSRARLLRAALELFAARGVAQVSVTQVAAASGVSKGLVYHYFKTKDELLAAVLEERVRAVSALAEALPEGLSSAAWLRGLARALVDAAREDPDGYRLLLRTLAHPQGGATIRALVRAREREFRGRAAAFARLFGDPAIRSRSPGGGDIDIDIAIEARFFQAALIGVLVQQSLSPLATADEADALLARLFVAVGIDEGDEHDLAREGRADESDEVDERDDEGDEGDEGDEMDETNEMKNDMNDMHELDAGGGGS